MAEKPKNNDFTDDERKIILFMGGDPDNFYDEDEMSEGEFLGEGFIVAVLAIIGLIFLFVVCSAG